jgi:serine phosphatase RsbU (regulator of sigma subunit)
MDHRFDHLFDGQELPSDEQLYNVLVNRLPPSTIPFLFKPHGSSLSLLNVTNLCDNRGHHIGLKPNAADCFHPLTDTLVSSPLRLTISQAQALFNSTALCDVWVLPFVDHDDRQWVVLVNEHEEISDVHAERFFFLKGWLFSRRDLEAARRELKQANQWIEEELEDISRLQQLMLPDKGLSIPGAKVAYTYRAMSGAGGDYLDVMDLSKKREVGDHDLGAIVADVTGHGPSAAIEAAMLDAILRTFVPKDKSEGPSEVLNYINRHFFTRKERSRFLTAHIFRFLGEEQTLTYANAGHPPAYIKRGNDVITLGEGGIPIGVLREFTWQSHRFPIHKGDVLFIYTDVVIETQNPMGEDFGLERVIDALASGPSDPTELLKYMEMQMRIFCQCRAFQDDMTMCAIQFV